MQTPSISFPDGQTGSTLLRAALADAASEWPSVFDGVAIPEGKAFKKALPFVLGEFECRRAAAEERVEIAAALAGHVAACSRWGDEPLSDALAGGEARPLQRVDGKSTPGWTPEVEYRGRTWSGRAIGELADLLLEHNQLTAAAAAGLKWVAETLLDEPVVLTDHRFALLGASAELAPTRYLLAAGADVVWVDRDAPALDPEGFAGTVSYSADALDLLAHTPSIAATIAREASEGPLHLGLYAYAPGKGRELLLTAAMNAIAELAEPASIAMLVSPTTPGEVQPEDRVHRARRRREAPGWQRALGRMKVLPEPAVHTHGDVEICKAIVPMQGPTYLAAQYLTKMMAAEAWAVDRAPLRVSANVAGITHTASLEHPLFLAGFAGAPLFGMEIFQPEQTRVLTTLLMLHDLLHPDAPVADTSGGPVAHARRIASQSIHGGVRSAPYVFDDLIRVAAVLGLSKRPGLLLALRG